MTLTNHYPSLSGKAVFITGGGSGIGGEITRHFALQGAKVAFVDIDDGASQTLCDGIERAGRTRPWYRHTDIRDIEALGTAIADAAQAQGGLHVLINNAARDDRHDFAEVTPDYWDECMAINLRPQFFATQKAASLMGDGACVITMGSVSWMRRRTGFVAYTTAKGAINALTRTLAHELGPKGIRVNCVVPGAIVTDRQKALWLDPVLEQGFVDEQALKFRLTPNEVVAMVLFLASDDSRGCAGQNFIVDGGIV